MLLGTTTIIVVVGGCKSIIPIFKEVTPEKNGWNKKGGNFLISRERGSTLFSSKVCAITRECEHIRPQFSGLKAFVDLTSYHPLQWWRNLRKFVGNWKKATKN